MSPNEVSAAVVDAAIQVHKVLGPGMLESVYEACLAHELERRGLTVVRQLSVPVVYRGLTLDQGYRLDLLVQGAVIVEVKSVEKVLAVHEAQLLTYLRLTDKRVGLLLNFYAPLMKDGIHRMVNGTGHDLREPRASS